ncbi:TetR/AcrR family transcriptional regulator [soil metagenome]
MAARVAVEHSAAPRKRPRQRRAHETVDRILTAAAHIFDERGYRATTTNHVAERAGVSIGSLYQYFPNKDALLVALAERHIRTAAEAFAERLAELRRAEPPMPHVTRSLVELTVAQNDTSRLHAIIYADGPRTPELTAELDRFAHHLIDEVALQLQRTGCGGADPRRRAALVVSAVDAAVHEVVLGLDPGPERSAAVDDLVSLVVHGLEGSTT